MQRAGRGSILNMSSIAWAIPSIGLPVYVTAKAAIVGMTRIARPRAWVRPHNIRVNCVLPGAIPHRQRQQRLWMSHRNLRRAKSSRSQCHQTSHILPDDVARLVLFLAADDSSAITSQSHIVDGGWI